MKFETSIERRMGGRHKACLSMEDFEGKRILDVGCSYGWFEKFVGNKAKEVIGIDLCKKDLEIAKKEIREKNVKFEKGSVLDLGKFKGNYFDVVVMFDVIEHIPKNTEKKALKKIKRVLKKDGKLLLSTPASNFSNFFDPAWYFGHRHYSRSKMLSIFEGSGFEVEKMEIRGGFWELSSMILFYPFKWFFNMEIPFKEWFDKRRDEEYLGERYGVRDEQFGGVEEREKEIKGLRMKGLSKGFVTLFVWGKKK